MADADKDILYRVAYDEAVRALSEQQGAIESFHTKSWPLALSGRDSLAPTMGVHGNPRDVIQTYIEADEPAPIEELHRDLSLHMHNSHIENRAGLEQLSAFFQIASGLLTIEVVLWIVAIASTALNRFHDPGRIPHSPPQSQSVPARCRRRRTGSRSARPNSPAQ